MGNLIWEINGKSYQVLATRCCCDDEAHWCTPRNCSKAQCGDLVYSPTRSYTEEELLEANSRDLGELSLCKSLLEKGADSLTIKITSNEFIHCKETSQ